MSPEIDLGGVAGLWGESLSDAANHPFPLPGAPQVAWLGWVGHFLGYLGKKCLVVDHGAWVKSCLPGKHNKSDEFVCCVTRARERIRSQVAARGARDEVAFRPKKVATKITESVGEWRGGVAIKQEEAPCLGWAILLLVVEEAIRLDAEEASPASRLRMPLLARTRFVVARMAALDFNSLSRSLCQTDNRGEGVGPLRSALEVVWGDECHPAITDDRSGARATPGGLGLGVLAEIAQARQDWLSCLEAYQSHIALAPLSGDRIEQEALDCILQGDAMVVLSSQDEAAGLALRVSENVLLPHFALKENKLLGEAVKRLHEGEREQEGGRVSFESAGSPPRTADNAPRAKSATSAPASDHWSLESLGRRMRWGRLQLRWMAASVVGAALMMELGQWTSVHGLAAAAVGIVLLTIAYGYLRLQLVPVALPIREARYRARRELLVGIGWGVVVAAVFTALLLPVFTDSLPYRYEDGWVSAVWGGVTDIDLSLAGLREFGTRAARFFLAVAWTTTAGVFLQALWDTEPISAPLNHKRWE